MENERKRGTEEEREREKLIEPDSGRERVMPCFTSNLFSFMTDMLGDS